MYCTSLGLYEGYLNGQKIGDQVLTPGWTSYATRLQYQTYDVTALLKPGSNGLGFMLGNGWYRAFRPNSNQNQDIKDLELLAQLEIEFSDGTRQVVKSDNTWKASTGGVIKSEIYDGEIYDARLEKKDWSVAGYDDKSWFKTTAVNRTKNNLVTPASEPVRRIEEIRPVKVIVTPQGNTVLDMGQNMVGWCRLKADCPAGTTIKLRHAEVLDKEGNFYTENLRSA